MITFAKREMIPELKMIWKECFGDSDSYIDLYFSKRFKEDNMLVYMTGTKRNDKDIVSGKPVSMLSLLPATLITKKGIKKIQYIYAVATLSDYRGNGFSSQLLKQAMYFIQKQNEYAVLVPASESLFSFYGKRGFFRAFDITWSQYRVQEDSAIKSMEIKEDVLELCDISAIEYKMLRDTCFFGIGYVSWDVEAVTYAIEEMLHLGGFCKKLRYEGNVYAALFYIVKDNHKLYVKEVTAIGETAEEIVKELTAYYNLVEAEAVFHVKGNTAEDSKSLAMLSDNAPKSAMGYFNLTLG